MDGSDVMPGLPVTSSNMAAPMPPAHHVAGGDLTPLAPLGAVTSSNMAAGAPPPPAYMQQHLGHYHQGHQIHQGHLHQLNHQGHMNYQGHHLGHDGFPREEFGGFRRSPHEQQTSADFGSFRQSPGGEFGSFRHSPAASADTSGGSMNLSGSSDSGVAN